MSDIIKSMFGKVLTAMVTPFNPDMSVNYDLAAKLAVHLADNGSDGILVHGTTGESPTLSHDEEFELYRVVKKALNGKAKLIAGTGSNSTSTSITSTKKAEELGVDGIMIVVPYYNKPSQEGMYQHFKAVAECTKLPIIIYNIPGRCVVNMQPETVARLAQIKNIIGIKDAAGNPEQTKKTRALVPADFIIWSGDDGMTLEFMKQGGAIGVISVASHLVGKEIHQMIDAYDAGDIKKAEELNQKLAEIFEVIFIAPNPTPVKAALEMLGWPVGKPRLPLIEATQNEKDQLKVVMEKLGLIK